jgi:hypothetical protein
LMLNFITRLRLLIAKDLIFAAFRLSLGYILAISAGIIVYFIEIFAIEAFSEHHIPKISFSDIDHFSFFFTFAAPFALPFTIVASLALHFLAPRRILPFLIVGSFCPIVAWTIASNMMINIHKGHSDWLLALGDAFSESHMLVLPGLLAAYFYGAIGFGYGFRRWKIT